MIPQYRFNKNEATHTLPQLRMLFQSTHEDRQGAEALTAGGTDC